MPTDEKGRRGGRTLFDQPNAKVNYFFLRALDFFAGLRFAVDLRAAFFAGLRLVDFFAVLRAGLRVVFLAVFFATLRLVDFLAAFFAGLRLAAVFFLVGIGVW